MDDTTQFPVYSLLPKRETGVTQFLSKYPEYDGRGIRIAILDNGVDPGAEGLQKTSEGKIKVVERFDCSGSGDVDTSTIVKINDKAYITGLTGRKLKIPRNWKFENGELHVGVKNAYDLYEKDLRERIKNEYKKKMWNKDHKSAVTEINNLLDNFKNTKDEFSLTEQDKLIKEDLEASIEFLNEMDKEYTDLGPVYDCVVFFDTIWKACIDTTECGDLENGLLLGEYSITQEYKPLTIQDQLNISINVYNNGNLLEIVGLCGSHGTHVASIAAAFFEDDPEKNGVAPGAEIIDLMIGDIRLNGMETGTSLVRAMNKVMQLHKKNPIHVINTSYGEFANWTDSGCIIKLMNDIIMKYGVIWVSSAGNNGPALCTIGTPPDISTNLIIGVGAYVSPEMMSVEYSMRSKKPATMFTWSSRGPTIDGDLGISICAPGAAITSVPKFTLQNAKLLNGTSMASPHVAGAIAILLSGLIQRNVSYSPFYVKRTLQATAKYIESIEPFAQGHGLLQVGKAFHNLVDYHSCPARDVQFRISCGNAKTKGILVRSVQLTHSILWCINITPIFKNNATSESKTNFNMHFILMCNASYIQTPTFLELQNENRSFCIKIDPMGLETGAYYTSIDAFDALCPEKGPMFVIPITIIQPVELPNSTLPILEWKDIIFTSNCIKRHFIFVPEYATWGVLKLTYKTQGQQTVVMVHCLQVFPHNSCKYQYKKTHSVITSQSYNTTDFRVKGSTILEVVIAKYWAGIGHMVFDYNISFYGIKPLNPNILMLAADGIYRVDVKTLRSEDVLPVITLKYAVQVLKSSDFKINQLTERDLFSVGRQIYELVLTYKFHLAKSTEVSPSNPLLDNVLYESAFESQLWMLFDENKRLLAAGDAYPEKYNIKLRPGDYMIKLQVRHEKKEYLERLVNIPMLLQRKLTNNISLDVYNHYNQTMISGKRAVAVKGCDLPIPLYISPFCTEKCKTEWSYLLGTITYAKNEVGKYVDMYPFKYIPYGTPNIQNKKETEWTVDEYLDQMKEKKIELLSKLTDSKEAQQIYDELKATHDDDIAIHLAMLEHIEPIEIKRLLPIVKHCQLCDINSSICHKIIELCDRIIGNVDVNKLLICCAIKTNPCCDFVKTKAAIDKQKPILLDAYGRKGIALCRLYLLKNTTDCQKKSVLDLIHELWQDILKFVDPDEEDIKPTTVLLFFIWHATVLTHYGRALKYLCELLDDKPLKEVEHKIAEMCESMSWKHCVCHITRSLLVKYPKTYRLF